MFTAKLLELDSFPDDLFFEGFGIAFIAIFVLSSIFITAVIVFIVVTVNRGAKAKKAQDNHLRIWAESRGFVFSAAPDTQLPSRYPQVAVLNRGSGRYAYNVVTGSYARRGFTMFDFHYETTSRDKDGRPQTSHHYCTVLVLHCGVHFPAALQVYPESLLDRLSGFIGAGDIDFESDEFSRAYAVRSADRRFAYHVIHQKMMEFLMAHPGTSFELSGDIMCMNSGNGTWQPVEWEARLMLASALADQLPDYLMGELKSR